MFEQKTYKYLLFDWDGTLVDSVGIWYEAACEVINHFKNVAQKKGKDFPELTQGRIIEMIHQGLRRHYLELGAESEQEIEDLYRQAGLHKLETVEMHEGVLEVLYELRRDKRYKLALVTSSIKKYLYIGLKRNNLEKFFDTIVANEDVEQLKPNPEPIQTAIRNLKGDAELSIMIGDSFADICAGKEAKVTTVIHYPEKNRRLYTEKQIKDLDSDYVIYNFKELLNILG